MTLRWNVWIRQTHRWLSILFTATVIADFTVIAMGKPMQWLYCMPLPPLFLLLFTGLYLFFLPYLPKGRAAAG
ncbi:MAG: hypothetical protein ACREHE_14730 [Rhizomicrobium sp.]